MADSLKSEAVFTRQERIAELAKQSREFAFLSLNHYLDLMDCSYGFRPGRSAHQALGALREGLMQFGGGWLLDVDIRKFFDTLQHGSLRELLRQRIRDGVVLRHETNPSPDEPDAGNLQVRISGSPGRVTARDDPAVGVSQMHVLHNLNKLRQGWHVPEPKRRAWFCGLPRPSCLRDVPPN